MAQTVVSHFHRLQLCRRVLCSSAAAGQKMLYLYVLLGHGNWAGALAGVSHERLPSLVQERVLHLL